jgi:hypothetical protein
MQNSSQVFKAKFDYYQRVAHKKLSKKNRVKKSSNIKNEKSSFSGGYQV